MGPLDDLATVHPAGSTGHTSIEATILFRNSSRGNKNPSTDYDFAGFG
jgi:hypothetical protein